MCLFLNETLIRLYNHSSFNKIRVKIRRCNHAATDSYPESLFLKSTRQHDNKTKSKIDCLLTCGLVDL